MAKYVGTAMLVCVVVVLQRAVCLAAAQPTPPSYLAAVLEYCPIWVNGVVSTETAKGIMLQNIASIRTHLEPAREAGADIVVLPEMSLCNFPFTTRESTMPYLLSLPPVGSNLAADPKAEFGVLAAIADLAFTTIVLDIPENMSCSTVPEPCPETGFWQLNTQIVVAPGGVLQSVYHKSHLFEGEVAYFDRPTWAPEMRVFDTPFGVRFGQFVCFDLFYRTPEVETMRTMGVTDFVFSTDWVNNALTPLIGASQLQTAFSRANKVNLLASNYGTTWVDSGSGIYTQGKALKFVYNPTEKNITTLLMDNVPIIPTPRSSVATPPPALPQQAPFADHPRNVTSITATPGSAGIVNVTSGSLSCQVQYKVSAASSPNAQVFGVYAWHGIGFQGLLPLRICGISFCPAGDCSQVGIDSATVFEKLMLTVQLPGPADDTSSPLYVTAGGLNADPLNQGTIALHQAQQGSLSASAWLVRSGTVINNVVLYQQQPGLPPHTKGSLDTVQQH